MERRGQIADDRVKRRLAGAALKDLDRNGVGLEDALRREQHPAALRLVVHEAHAARQARPCVRRYRSSFRQIASMPQFAPVMGVLYDN